MDNLNFNHLWLFYHVARTGSVTRAARELRISQPAVSRQVQQLAEDLGVTLMARAGRGLVLTEEGRLLYGYAQRIFGLSGEAVEALAEWRGQRAGRLGIGAGGLLGNYLLPMILKRYLHRHPDVAIRVLGGEREAIEAGVLRGELDVGFLEDVPRSTGLQGTPVLQGAFNLYQGSSQPVEAAMQTLLLPGSQGTWTSRVRDRLAKEGASFPRELVLGSTESVKQGVLQGLGVGFLPEYAVREEVAQGRLSRVPGNQWRIPHRVFYALAKGRRPAASLLGFLAVVRGFRG